MGRQWEKNRSHVLFVMIFVSFFVWGRASLGAKLLPSERTITTLYKKCNPAVVNITTVTLKQNFFSQVYPEKGVGSGAIVRKNGYIVTNDHVLGDAQKISVTLSDKSEYPARIVGRDPDTDLAVLKIDVGRRALPTLKFAKREELAVGQLALAIGNPFGLGGSLSVGRVSSLGRDIKAQTGLTIKDVIQTDAAINPGNSGGPLLNSSGEIIGINAQIFSTSGGSVGVGFAISVKTAKRNVEQLIQFGKVLRPWLGVSGVDFGPSLLRNFRIPVDYGVMVTEVYRRSPAARSGLRAADKELVWGRLVIPVGGDVIYRVDNQNVRSFRDLRDYILNKKSGTSVTLFYVRGQKKLSSQIKLKYPPDVLKGSF